MPSHFAFLVLVAVVVGLQGTNVANFGTSVYPLQTIANLTSNETYHLQQMGIAFIVKGFVTKRESITKCFPIKSEYTLGRPRDTAVRYHLEALYLNNANFRKVFTELHDNYEIQLNTKVHEMLYDRSGTRADQGNGLGRDKRAIPLIVAGVVVAAVAIAGVIADCIITYNLRQEIKELAAAQKAMNDAFNEQQKFNELTKSELLREMKSKHDELLNESWTQKLHFIFSGEVQRMIQSLHDALLFNRVLPSSLKLAKLLQMVDEQTDGDLSNTIFAQFPDLAYEMVKISPRAYFPGRKTVIFEICIPLAETSTVHKLVEVMHVGSFSNDGRFFSFAETPTHFAVSSTAEQVVIAPVNWFTCLHAGMTNVYMCDWSFNGNPRIACSLPPSRLTCAWSDSIIQPNQVFILHRMLGNQHVISTTAQNYTISSTSTTGTRTINNTHVVPSDGIVYISLTDGMTANIAGKKLTAIRHHSNSLSFYQHMSNAPNFTSTALQELIATGDEAEAKLKATLGEIQGRMKVHLDKAGEHLREFEKYDANVFNMIAEFFSSNIKVIVISIVCAALVHIIIFLCQLCYNLERAVQAVAATASN